MKMFVLKCYKFTIVSLFEVVSEKIQMYLAINIEVHRVIIYENIKMLPEAHWVIHAVCIQLSLNLKSINIRYKESVAILQTGISLRIQRQKLLKIQVLEMFGR